MPLKRNVVVDVGAQSVFVSSPSAGLPSTRNRFRCSPPRERWDPCAPARGYVKGHLQPSSFPSIFAPAPWLILSLCLSVLAGALSGAEVIPPGPTNHFNDEAGLVSPEVARRLNQQLVQFERDTSNQIVVAIYPRMQSDSSIEDYTVRVAQSWGVGQKDRRNGAVLFIFQQDRSLFIQVGYGLEGVLPDARCKQIIENEITPRFRTGDFEGGVVSGVQAILASVRGEYQGTGGTVRDSQGQPSGGGGFRGWMVGAFILLIILQSIFGRRRNTLYSRRGRRGMWMFPGGGGSWGGGGGRMGGGGSFSGGGGSFGGGGAGGRW